MAWVHLLLARMATLFTGARLDAELRAELEEHVRLAADDRIRRGMDPHEATRQARLRLGGVAQTEERHRHVRGLPLLETVIQDVSYALRMLRRNPGFAAVTVLTLAVGIGATTAMFSVLHAVLLRPLPYAQPDRLVEIFETNPLKGWTRSVVAPANYADWQRMNSVFTDIAATNGSGDRGEGQFDAFLTGAGDPQRVKALQTTGNLFEVLGTPPLLGRTFTEEETFDGKQRVAILGYGLWRTLFAGDTHVVGRTISLSGRAYEVVGVMPPSFFYPSRDIELWVPVGYKRSIFSEARRPHWMRAVARLKPGVTFEQARDEMQRIASRLERTYPATNTKMGVRLEKLHDAFAFGAETALMVLFAAVGTLFLVVCVNVAGLQLGRAAGRTREMAIRRASGASRGRLIRQLVTEGLVLSAAGGALGVLLAEAAKALLVEAAPAALPLFADLTIDRAVVGFAVALSLVAPVLFGLAPAVVSSRSTSLVERVGTGSRGQSRLRRVLVAFEVALAAALAVAAVLLVRSLVLLEHVEPGFASSHAIVFKVTLPMARYPDDPHQLAAAEEIERRLSTESGFAAVGAASTLALGGTTWTGDATVEGRAADDYERELRHEAVTPGYLSALGARLIEGRWLNPADREKSPAVAVVNATLAAKYFRGADALGKRISFGRPTDKPNWVTVVGVVADIKQDGLDQPVQPEVFVPLAQEPQNPLTYVVRAAQSPDAALAEARAAIRGFDKELVMTDAGTLDGVLRQAAGDQRFRTMLLGAFATITILLAALGVYGVLAYFVAERRREIGVRLALGAAPATVLKLVIGQGLEPVILGLGAGLLAAIAVGRWIQTLLFGVVPLDPLSYVAAATALVAVGAAASAVPALRAVHVDPAIALRQD
jgi:predicted permease